MDSFLRFFNLRKCANCASCGWKINYEQCGRCKATSYCSKGCQRKHWSKHKKECAELRRNRRQNKNACWIFSSLLFIGIIYFLANFSSGNATSTRGLKARAEADRIRIHLLSFCYVMEEYLRVEVKISEEWVVKGSIGLDAPKMTNESMNVIPKYIDKVIEDLRLRQQSEVQNHRNSAHQYRIRLKNNSLQIKIFNFKHSFCPEKSYTISRSGIVGFVQFFQMKSKYIFSITIWCKKKASKTILNMKVKFL